MPNESENTRSTISNIRKMLSQAEKGGVQNTIQNCVTVLQNDPILADSIRLNLLKIKINDFGLQFFSVNNFFKIFLN